MLYVTEYYTLGPHFVVLANFGISKKNRLTSMIDTLGLPIVFFTLSAADLQWPELARLLNVEDPGDSAARSKAVVNNPCVSDQFFYQRVVKFMDLVFFEILNVDDYWLRFERQSTCPWHCMASQCS